MNKLSTLLLALGVVGFSSADTVLYAPAKSIADQQISVHPWASGTITETDETGFAGANSIRFSTRNMFSGGKIVFNGNPDLSKDYSDKSILLELTFKVADGSTVMGAGSGKGPGAPTGPNGAKGFGGGPGGKGGAVGGGPAGGGPAGGGAGARGGGAGQAGAAGFAGFGAGRGGGGQAGGPPGAGLSGAGGFGRGGNTTQQPKSLKTLRLVFTTTDGLKSEVYVPADVAADANGWRQVGIPLQVISGFEKSNKVIKDVSIGGDMTTTVWIGALQTISDQTPIRGEANTQDLNLAEGDEVTLSASGYGGASMLKYKWYFGEDTSGIPDAEGQAIKHKFMKPEEFKITLVISDYFGLKQPYKTTINVKVN